MQQTTISILGAGWLGLPLGQFLVEKGYHVKGSTTSDSKISKIQAAGMQAFLLRVGDQVAGINVVDFFDSDILILNIPPSRRNLAIEETYPKQVAAVLEKAKLKGVSKIIFASSTGVYGNENATVTEQTTLRPTRKSGKALVQAEQLVKKSGLDWIVLRFAGLVGKDRKAGKFLAGRKDVKNSRSYVNLVHQEDCINVIYRLLLADHWNEIFNVCSDHHPQKEAYYTAQALKEGLEPPSFLHSTSNDFKIVSNKKLKDVLNYSFIYPDPMQFP